MAEGGSSSVTKYAQIAAVISTLGAGGAAGYGYMAEDRGAQRQEIVVQARVGKVWELLSDPVNTPRWLPQDMLDIEKVETLGPKGIEKLADFFGASDTPTPKPGEVSHILHVRDGRQLKLAVTQEEAEKVYRQTIVLKEGQLDKYTTSAEWGFEVERTEESRRETKVTFIRKLKFARPLGVLRELYYRFSGKRAQEDLKIFQGIERAARDI